MSSLRIKATRELQALRESKRLGERAASRIEKELQAAVAKSNAQKVKSAQNRSGANRSLKLADIQWCAVPPIEPADILYQAMVRRWGRYYSGGEVVWELMPFSDSNYRLDASLVHYRVGVELDGWQFHGRTLSGFQRDREKQLLFCRRGWLLFRISNAQVRMSWTMYWTH